MPPKKLGGIFIMERILVIDLSAILHAVKFSLGKHRLSNEDKPTFVIYGFMMNLPYLFRKVRPTKVVFALDSQESHRKKLSKIYKEKRSKNKTEEQIALDALAYPQFAEIETKLLQELGFSNIFGAPGFEADDIIASICDSYPYEQIVIYSGDKDMYQLLTKNVSIIDTRTNIPFTLSSFSNKYKISPKLWSEVKAIGGCSSDNVLGIPIPQSDKTKKRMRVGEVTALKYLRGELPAHYKAYKAIERPAGRIRVKHNRKLVKLPFVGTPRYVLQDDHVTISSIKDICNRYGFKSILGKIEDWHILCNE